MPRPSLRERHPLADRTRCIIECHLCHQVTLARDPVTVIRVHLEGHASERRRSIWDGVMGR